MSNLYTKNKNISKKYIYILNIYAYENFSKMIEEYFLSKRKALIF